MYRSKNVQRSRNQTVRLMAAAAAAAAHTERWVQCSLCTKWRVVPDTLRVDASTTPWRCAYNVFSTVYNKCSAPQEPMPAAEQGDQAAPPPSAAEVANELFAGYVVAEENSAADLFCESKCACALCTSTNAAVRGWDAMVAEGHAVPLVQCVLNAISNSTHVAAAAEEDKRFLYAPSDDPPKRSNTKKP